MKIKEFLTRFKETPGWWLVAAAGVVVILKMHLVILSLPYLGFERLLLTMLSLLTMYVLGAAGFRAYGHRFLVYLVPLILIIAGNYLNLSFKYLEVNPLAAVWLALLYLSIFTFLEKDTFLHKVLIPGILCGLALSVNYSLYPVLLSPLLSILVYPGKQKVARLFLLTGVTLAVFLALLPLSFALFVPLDMLGIGSYSYHHHIDWTLKGLCGDFGIGGLLLSLFGLVTAFKKDWKKTIIFIVFPLLLLVYAFFAVFAALGIIELYRLSRERLKLKTIPAVAAAAVLFCLCFPPYKPVLQWAKAKAEPDSRLRVVQWVRANVPKGAALVVPVELEMNTSSLRDDYQVYTREFKQLKQTSFETLAALLKEPYFLVPNFTAYDADGLTAKDLKRLEEFKKNLQVNAVFAGHKALLNYYRPLPAGNPEVTVGHMASGAQEGQAAMASLTPSPGVWDAHAVPPQNTSPALKTFFEKGKFVYDFTASNIGNVLAVHSTAADEKGVRQASFGFEAGQKGFAVEAPAGQYIYLVVSASVSPHLPGEDNFMFISTQSGQTGGWGVEKQSFSAPGGGMQTYILAKKIQPGTTRLIMGFRFTPQSMEDRLIIRHIGIYVSDKPM